ncbi:MAG TPA: universal stress protein [Casimicrobiaceae bacterium]|jgi:nucleotide-binding universal stress UspA family protein|nr:universal stress protein [Casimicrobiaceae bacterium]
MLKILHPVDGSESSTRATRQLIAALDWYRERPRIDLVTVHLPVPRFPNMGVVVGEDTIERYYGEECAAMLAPSKKALDAAGVKYESYRRVGAIAESIVEQAKESKADMIFMGTRGMTALSNIVLGSVATRVLHLAHLPVVMIP